jgi:hypothetical protein
MSSFLREYSSSSDSGSDSDSDSENTPSGFKCYSCDEQCCTFECHPKEGCYYCNHDICENPLHLTAEDATVVKNRTLNCFLCDDADYDRVSESKCGDESKQETKQKKKTIGFGANHVDEFTELEPDPQSKRWSRAYICGDRYDHAYMKRARKEKELMLDAKRIQFALKCADCISRQDGFCKYHNNTVSATYQAIKRLRNQLPLVAPLPQLCENKVTILYRSLFSKYVFSACV